MPTIQMTIDESLLSEVDKTVQRLGISRGTFILNALCTALKQQQILALEYKHRKGYSEKPVEPGEFDVWENEQHWEDL